MAILSIVALAGYDLKLELDPNDPINAAIKSINAPPKAEPKPNAPAQSAYTSNAQNVIQNNVVHANASPTTTNNGDNKNSSNFRSYVNLNERVCSSEEAVEVETTVEKVNPSGGKKYTISGTASNLVVKQIVDKMMTKFIADKFATQSDAEVSHP